VDNRWTPSAVRWPAGQPAIRPARGALVTSVSERLALSRPRVLGRERNAIAVLHHIPRKHTSSREIPVANIKSQIKRIKTNEKARLRNKAVKSQLRTAVRTVREAAKSGDKSAATTALEAASRRLDKAASKGVIHKNQAANRKSALAKAVAGI